MVLSAREEEGGKEQEEQEREPNRENKEEEGSGNITVNLEESREHKLTLLGL